MQLPIVITFVIYVLLVFLVGYAAYRVTKNLSDYVLGGRCLNGPLAALGAGASDMSSWLMLALPGAVFTLGLSQIWLPIGLAIGAWLNWQLVAKRLRIYTEVANDALTIPAYLHQRFHDSSQWIRGSTAVIIIVFFTFYTAAGFVSAAFLLQSLFSVSYHYALWLGAFVIVFYTCIGGFLAINWIDLFQGCLMLIALLMVPAAIVQHFGGLTPTLTQIHAQGASFFEPVKPLEWMTIVSLLSWGVGYFGQPHILVRFMAAKTEKVIPLAKNICMVWMIISLLGAILTGFFAIAYFSGQTVTQPEKVFLMISGQLFNPWLAGILFAAVLSAMASTASAQLLASASAVVEDLYHAYCAQTHSPARLLWMGRLTVLLIAVVAIYLASNPNSSIFILVGYAWAGLGASFGPVIFMSLYWKRMTRTACLLGLLAGAATVLVWPFLKPYGGVFEIYELVPGFLLSLMVIVATSLLDKTKHDRINEDFETVKKRLNHFVR